MPGAARVGDPTGHPGIISGPGVVSVLIGGQPAAVALEMPSANVCAMPATAGPHPTAPCPMGSRTVLIAGRPALRQWDTSACGAPITVGFPQVQIGG
jgi:uncharacterized Zn-binding protein involved in type VI secretion